MLKNRILKLEAKKKLSQSLSIFYVDFENERDILVYNDPTRKLISREDFDALNLEENEVIELE